MSREPTFVPGRFSPVAALGYPEFRLLWFGGLLGNLGNWMQQFAVGWLVVQLAIRDGNPALGSFYLGLLGLARFAPSLTLGMVGGVFADRMDRRLLLVLTRVASLVLAGLLAALVISDGSSLAWVMVLTAATAAVFVFDAPGRLAILPSLVGGGEAFSAMGLARASMQITALIGPLVGGLIIVPFGTGGVLLGTTVMYGAALVLTLLLPPRPAEPGAREVSIVTSLREGVGYIRSDPLVGAVTVFGAWVAFFAWSYVQLLPAVAQDTLGVGAIELSWLVGASGAGGIVGSVLAASSGGLRRRGRAMLICAGALGSALLAFGLQRGLVGALVTVALLGCAMVAYTGTQSNLLQALTPDALRGRVMGTQNTIWTAGAPLGTLVLGTLGAAIGVSSALACSGLALLALTLLTTMRSRVIREEQVA